MLGRSLGLETGPQKIDGIDDASAYASTNGTDTERHPVRQFDFPFVAIEFEGLLLGVRPLEVLKGSQVDGRIWKDSD